MADHYEWGTKEPVASDEVPSCIAQRRASVLPSVLDQTAFLTAFSFGLVAELDGIDTWRVLDDMYRKDKSAAIAGYLEGLAAARRHDVKVGRS